MVPQVAWSACNLSATTPSEVNTARQLTNADTAALTEAAKRGDDITDCDVSEITDMSGLFYFHPNSFNQDIGDWDVSKVTNMDNMFRQTYVFNQDIGDWDTSSVTSMLRTFVFSYDFNQDISRWDVSNVTSFFATFESATDFNQDIRGWDVSSATTFQGMFMNATAMNANFSTPNTPTSSFFVPRPRFTFDPADTDTGVAVDSNVTITVSETIRLVAAEETLDNDNVDALITLKETNSSGANVAFDATISGDVITINPTSDFSSLQQVYVAIDGTRVEDTSDNAGLLASATFTVVDTDAPTLASSTPSDNATGVAIDADLVLTFSEAVDAETGDIVIKKTSDDTAVETFDVTTDVAGSGTTTITINPTSDFAYSTSYYVMIASTAFDDAAGNSYAGITGTTTLNFETADVTAPTLASSTPSDNATGVAIDADLVLTFSEAVDAETGDIVIKKTADDTAVETFDVTTDVTGSGTTTITINPTSDFAYSTSYYVTIASTAFDDAASNSYAGITGSTTLNFETAAAPAPPADTTRPTVTLSSPSSAATKEAFEVTARFSEAVTGFEAEDITVSNGEVFEFAATSTQVYTFKVTPTAEGDATVDVAENVAKDSSNNLNRAAITLTRTYDVTPPSVEITGPQSATSAFTATMTFSEAVVGLTQDDVTVTGGSLSSFAGTGAEYTATITPDGDAVVTVVIDAAVATDAAGNDNTASNVLTVAPSTPALEFARHKEEVTGLIQADARRGLRSSMSSSQSMAQDVRQRLIQSPRTEGSGLGAAVPFNVNGTAQFARGLLSTSGTFYELLEGVETGQQRLFYGDFGVQRDADGDTTASLNAKMAWEQQLDEASLLGYFVGGSFGTSDIGRTFEGSNDQLSLEAGLYGARNLSQNIYLDGYAALGFGLNDMALDNGVLELDSRYNTRSFTTGVALSAVYTQTTYELRPEIALNYGKTWIGDVGFTGRAYGLTDDTLSFDGGSVSLGSLTLRPEFIIPLDQQHPSQSNANLSLAPRLLCEQNTPGDVRADDCGSGAEIGLGYSSDDGLGHADIKLMMDNIAGGTRSSWTVSVERKF
ncbi:Ig-like domain-containing protein [Planktomarina temperata]|nr:Ig-like domain-containing protein [Planktomarina temperata]